MIGGGGRSLAVDNKKYITTHLKLDMPGLEILGALMPQPYGPSRPATDIAFLTFHIFYKLLISIKLVMG
jgi:hypothetical protein